MGEVEQLVNGKGQNRKSIYYEGLRKWFLTDIYPAQVPEVEKKFIAFVKNNSEEDSSLKAFISKKMKLGKEDAKKLTELVQGFFGDEKEKTKCEKEVEHDPYTSLKLAGVFIAIKDYRVCSELIWMATTMALKTYADNNYGIKLDTHKSLSVFCEELVTEIGTRRKRQIIGGHWRNAQDCHSLGFYDDKLGSEALEEALKTAREFVDLLLNQLRVYTFSSRGLQRINNALKPKKF